MAIRIATAANIRNNFELIQDGFRLAYDNPTLSLDADQLADSWGGGIPTQFALFDTGPIRITGCSMDLAKNEFCPCLFLLPVSVTIANAEALMKAGVQEALARWPTLRTGSVIAVVDPRSQTGKAALQAYRVRYPNIAGSIRPDGMWENRWTMAQVAQAWGVVVP